jgi:hypothetical protein
MQLIEFYNYQTLITFLRAYELRHVRLSVRK